MNTLSSTSLSPFSPMLSSLRIQYLHPIKMIANNPDSFKFTHNQPPKHQSLPRTILKSFDDFICDFIDSPLPPSLDPQHVLSGNFAPVEELPPTPCAVVEGSLPSSLDGVYIRNGPNPQFIPRGPYHLFDGDGMLHMIKISAGKATFCSRYVRTYKYTVEREIQHPVVPSPFSSFHGVASSFGRLILTTARILTTEFNPVINGFGTANTSLALIGGKLYALCESDLPYEIRVTADGDITTVKRHDFHARKKYCRMTAHPKIDPKTGETFAFRYDLFHPRLTFFRIDSNGRKHEDVEIYSMKSAAVIHDFAVTENYVVFNDMQMVMSPVDILRGRQPIRVDLEKVPRVGIIGRYAENDEEMVWIDAAGLNLLHVVNAWEEDGGETVVVVGNNLVNVGVILERMDMAESRMEEVRINVKEKKLISRRRLSSRVHDLAMINQAYIGKKTRYVYAPVVRQPSSVVGIVKIDLSTSFSDTDADECIVASHMYERGCTGGEPFYVAKREGGEEDKGFLVTYLHDENKNESKFVVMDATSPTLQTVCVVRLPGRVPTGFHGLFLSQTQLIKQ